jgi:dipeptidyl-peptidase 4
VRIDELSPEAVHERGRLSFGEPRAIRVARSGDRVALLRSPDARSAEQELWLLERDDAGGWSERRLDGAAAEVATTESRAAAAMRERMRELASGIVEFAGDADLDVLVFAAGGGLWRFTAETGELVRLPGADGGEAPLLSPDGSRLAFLAGGTLHVVPTEDPASPVATVAPAHEHEAIGRPDFIAAEEIGRFEGMWWSPDSADLLFQRTDDSGVPEWTIADPGNPSAAPLRVRYPAANGPNARLALELLDASTGSTRPLTWDTDAYPYLCRAVWSASCGLTIDVQSRDQRTLVTLAASVDDGSTREVARLEDPVWVAPGNGTRAHAPDGRLCRLLDRDGARVVAIGDDVACPGVTAIHGVCGDGLLVEVATTVVDRCVALLGWDGSVEWVSAEQGLAHAWGGGDTVVVQRRALDHARAETTIGDHVVTSTAEPLEWDEQVELFTDLADGGSAAALVLPFGYDAGRDGPLPVLLDPYGGPGFARVSRDRRAYVMSRWLAEHGYAVLAVDGVGVPGRSPVWEQAIHGDFTRTLDSQIAALHEVASRRPGVLDLDRVGIRGWSFGGWLSALAAIREPELIRAAGVGAPVSDWTLYDTHYTERYLGVGDGFAEAAAASSLTAAIEATLAAGRTPSPMLILHGFEDDNVVVAHSIRLSETLTLHGIPHSAILLPSLTHIGRTPALPKLQRLELEFFDRHLRRR